MTSSQPEADQTSDDKPRSKKSRKSSAKENGGDTTSLQEMIASRQRERATGASSLIDRLEQKYGGKKK